MKTNSTLRIALFIFILPLIIFSACQNRKTVADDNFYWTPIEPVSDSLMREYELVIRGINKVPGRVDTLAAKLDSVASVTGNNQILARYLIVKAYTAKKHLERSLVVKYLDSARNITDSVKYPYDYARTVVDQGSLIGGSIADIYRELQSPLKTFKEVNDSFYIGFVYNYLGAMGESICDENRAVELFSLAGDWLPKRMKYAKSLTYLNTTLSLYRQGKTAEWYPRVDSLKNSEFRYSGDRNNLWTMILSYERDKDVRDLQEAYRYACMPMSPDWGKPWVASILAEHYLDEGNRDSMLYYAKEMRGLINPQIGHYEDILRVNAMVYKAEGKNDSARICEKELETVLEKKAAVEDTVKVQNAEQQREIAEIDRKMEQERKQSEQRIWIISVSAVVMTLIVIILVVRLIRRRHDRERIALESTLEKNNRRVVAVEMKVAEKEKALSEIARDIQAIKPDEPEVASRILSTINVNRSGDADWEKFQLLFGEMHPDFADDLRREYPALTAGDVKLACLIFLGLETKQIARILSINPDSVKKNRQRLRAKLGLTPEQPLDLMLRDFERDRRKGRK